FVHLAEHEAGLVEHAGFFHFVVQVVTFTSTLTNTGKHRVSTVEFCNVINKLGNKDGLTNTSTSEETSFTTLYNRGDEVNRLNTSFKNLCFAALLVERWSGTVNW